MADRANLLELVDRAPGPRRSLMSEIAPVSHRESIVLLVDED